MIIRKRVLESPLSDAHLRAVSPVPDTVPQSGCTCKLVALRVAMSHAAHWDAGGRAVAVRRCDVWPALPKTVPTLRSMAKKYFGSQVGEMYEASSLAALARLNGFSHARAERPESEDYISRLRELVDRNCVAVVFYAANIHTGNPDSNSADCHNEHAAAVVGYTQVNGRLAFVLAQWSRYQVVDSEMLEISTAQLPDHSGETFVKGSLPGAANRWFEKEYLGSSKFEPAFGVSERRSAAGAPSMRHNIVVIREPNPPETESLTWWRRLADWLSLT